MDSVFSELNLAFTRKSAEEVSSVLHKYSSSPQYHDYEAYALKKTRQLIIENDLEFARQTSLAVIDNNLENFDAVELYSYIDRAILNEQAAKQAEENRKDRHACGKHHAGSPDHSGHMQPPFLCSFRYAVIILPACCANKIPMGQNCERLGRGE